MFVLIKLLTIFFKIGLFTFGGGYAMLPLLKREIVNRHNFLTEEELLDLYSIGQCTPGIIAINVATFIGYRQKGVWGAIFSTLGMILPSLFIIILIASILKQYIHHRYVIYAFSGIRICVVALLADIAYELWKKNVKNINQHFIFIFSIILLSFFNISAVWIVILSALIAFGLEEFQLRRKK